MFSGRHSLTKEQFLEYISGAGNMSRRMSLQPGRCPRECVDTLEQFLDNLGEQGNTFWNILLDPGMVPGKWVL
jgi:hypothetical protein